MNLGKCNHSLVLHGNLSSFASEHFETRGDDDEREFHFCFVRVKSGKASYLFMNEFLLPDVLQIALPTFTQRATTLSARKSIYCTMTWFCASERSGDRLTCEFLIAFEQCLGDEIQIRRASANGRVDVGAQVDGNVVLQFEVTRVALG